MPIYNLSLELELLQKVANGDEIAFKNMFELYKSKVFSFVLKFVHSKADAEEIVQDTFFTIWQKRSTLSKIEHPRNYIYTIVRNNTYTYLKKAAKNKALLSQLWANMQLESNETDDIIELKDSKFLIKTGLAQLSTQKQLIFNLSREDGLSHEEIATKVGLSKSRVKNIIVDVLKHLRFSLSKNELNINLTAIIWYYFNLY